MLLWRGEQLSSPDTVAVKYASISRHGIIVQIELRRFEGALHANVVSFPIVEVSIGALEPGRYQVSIEITERWFSDLDHPENAAKPSSQHTSFSFLVE